MPLITGDDLHQDGLILAGALAETLSPIESVEVNTTTYSSTYVDLKWIPRVNLLTHIEGSSWVVDYYSQILNTDSNLSGQQYTKNAAYQSYKLIKNMEMKVSSALSTSQDSESKGMTSVGTSLLYPFLIPNEGDMFVADIGEGKRACFRVTDSVKKSIFKEACYEITYGLSDDDNTGDILDLEKKAIVVYHFQKNFLTYGQNPLVITSDHENLLQLEKTHKSFTERYFKRFFSHEFKTMLVPMQEGTVYDHFLVDYLLSIFSVNDSHEVKSIRKLNVDDDQSMHSDSIWSALKRRDVTYIEYAFKESGLVSTRAFTSDAILEGIRYTGIDKVIYPSLPDLTVDYMHSDKTKLLNIENITPSTDGNINLIDNVIYPVTIDNYYVLSRNFYNRTTNQSVLEDLVWKYLENKELNINDLVKITKSYPQWGALEQFYYLPIIMTLIKSAIRGI